MAAQVAETRQLARLCDTELTYSQRTNENARLEYQPGKGQELFCAPVESESTVVAGTTEARPSVLKGSEREYPGALIVVEGTDGSGKSTQLYLLKPRCLCRKVRLLRWG